MHVTPQLRQLSESASRLQDDPTALSRYLYGQDAETEPVDLARLTSRIGKGVAFGGLAIGGTLGLNQQALAADVAPSHVVTGPEPSKLSLTSNTSVTTHSSAQKAIIRGRSSLTSTLPPLDSYGITYTHPAATHPSSKPATSTYTVKDAVGLVKPVSAELAHRLPATQSMVDAAWRFARSLLDAIDPTDSTMVAEAATNASNIIDSISPFKAVSPEQYTLDAAPAAFQPAAEANSSKPPFADITSADYTMAPPTANPKDPQQSPPLPSSPGQLPESAIPLMMPNAPQENIDKYFPLIMDALKKVGLDDGQMEDMVFATDRVEVSNLAPIAEYGANPSMSYWPYYGRGFVQLTWKSNYRAAGDAIGVDLVDNPDLALQPEVAAEVEAWFFKQHERPIRQALDSGDLAAARRIVNGGTSGLSSFTTGWNIGQRAIKATRST